MHCLIIICKYFSLSHKPDYHRSRFKYLPICFTVSVIKKGFRFDKAKKIKSRANRDDIVDQITERNNDNTLGIPRRANLELKHWPSVHNFFQFGAVIDY